MSQMRTSKGHISVTVENILMLYYVAYYQAKSLSYLCSKLDQPFKKNQLNLDPMLNDVAMSRFTNHEQKSDFTLEPLKCHDPLCCGEI